MRIGDLTAPQVEKICLHEGLTWQVGPFAVRVRSSMRRIARALRFLYHDFRLLDSGAIVDAEIVIRRKRLWPLSVVIRVDGAKQYDWLNAGLAVPMLEWTMNVCVFQRPHQYLMLHAAVVSRDDRALLLPGQAGAGKSTICAALVGRGWRLLSDEVALIRPDRGDLLPVPRPISLKDDSIDLIHRLAPRSIVGPKWHGTSKGTVAHVLPPSDSVGRASQPAVPTWIVFPTFDRNGVTRIEPLAKARACIHAADQAFNYSVHGLHGFETLTRLVDRCSCFELAFNDLESGLSEIEQVTERVGSHPVA